MPKFTGNGLETYLQAIPDSGAAPAPVLASNLSNTNPAIITVGPSNIALFQNSDTVTVAGATGDLSAANGPQVIANLATGPGTFELSGVDLSAAAAPQPTGVSVTPQAPNAPVDAPLTNLTNANPAVAAVAASDIGLFHDDDMVTVSGTNTSLDGKTFLAASVNSPANTVTLRGANLSGNTTPVSTGTLTVVEASDMLRFCLRQLEREVEAADAIDVSTFCGAESIAGTPTPGTVSIEGFIDYQVAAYNEWRKAVADGQRRLLHVKLPDKAGSGDIIMVITPSGLTETFEVNEASSFSGEAVINEEPLYLV
jgi:hypothetical protein